MSNAPSYEDDIFEALGIPSDPAVHKEVGITIVDPYEVGEDYPFKLQVRRIGTGSLEEVEGTTGELPDLAEHGLELIIIGEVLKDDGCLSKILLARPITKPRPDPTKMIGRGTWVQFPATGVEICCIPKPIIRKIDRKVDPDAEKRCGNCRLWDKQLGHEEYTRITHVDAPFGGDRQMWKDISDYEAKFRKLRRLDPNRIGLCLETDTIYDQDMECCDKWEAE